MGWVCNVGSLELYSIQNGSLTDMQYGYGTLGIIVHPFAGLYWGPEFNLKVDITTNYEGIKGLEVSLDTSKFSVSTGRYVLLT